MLLDVLCFLHDKFPGRPNTFEGGRNGRMDRRNFVLAGKMYRGIEKGTKTVE
jgi:hypothetical protein